MFYSSKPTFPLTPCFKALLHQAIFRATKSVALQLHEQGCLCTLCNGTQASNSQTCDRGGPRREDNKDPDWLIEQSIVIQVARSTFYNVGGNNKNCENSCMLHLLWCTMRHYKIAECNSAFNQSSLSFVNIVFYLYFICICFQMAESLQVTNIKNFLEKTRPHQKSRLSVIINKFHKKSNIVIATRHS